jgi:hypothetical protein
MDKLQLTGQTLGRVFSSRSGCMLAMQLLSSVAAQPNVKLKTRPKQCLGTLPLDIVLPGHCHQDFYYFQKMANQARVQTVGNCCIAMQQHIRGFIKIGCNL